MLFWWSWSHGSWRLTLFILLTQCALCMIAAIVSAIFDTSDSNADRKYLNLRDNNGEVSYARKCKSIVQAPQYQPPYRLIYS
eukprot:5402697-Amphidinium_carterae.1